jgi:hypothetical protein
MDRYYKILESDLFVARHNAYSKVKKISFKEFPRGLRGYKYLFILSSLIKEILWVFLKISIKKRYINLNEFRTYFLVSSVNHSRMYDRFISKYNNVHELKSNSFKIRYDFSQIFNLIHKYFITSFIFLNTRHYTNFSDYLRYISYTEYLKYSNINNICVIFVNDHSPFEVSFNEKLKSNPSNKTAYLQHSYINLNWPKFYFDYTFLDGNYFKKLLEPKCDNTSVFLVGNMYLEKVHIPNKNKNKNIAVAISQSSDLIYVNEICRILYNKYKVPIIIRFHPGDNRDFSVFDKNFQISHGKIEKSSKFLSRISYLIGGNTNILYEAFLSGIYSIYSSKLDRAGMDYYGFVSLGLVYHQENLKNLSLEDVDSFVSQKKFKLLHKNFSEGHPNPNYINSNVQKLFK